MAAMYARSRSVCAPMASALCSAATPAFRSSALGGVHSGRQRLIAMPQLAIAQELSLAATAVNSFSAASYQNEYADPWLQPLDHAVARGGHALDPHLQLVLGL